MKSDFDDVGCYGDGALGHDHCRSRLADLLETYRPEGWEPLAAELRGAMSDDDSETMEACDLLSDRLGVVVGFHDGDLMIMPESWEGWVA